MVKQENNNYTVSKDSYGRYKFIPVDNFSHVIGLNYYFIDTTLYNDEYGNLVVEGKRLNGTLAGHYFPEEIVNYDRWYMKVEINDAINYIEEDDPINKTAIKETLSKCTEKKLKFYLFGFTNEYFYEYINYEFMAYYRDDFTEKEMIISNPYEVNIKV